jgi:hypothetical protein
MAAPSPVLAEPADPPLGVDEAAVELSNPGFQYLASFTRLRVDELGEVLEEADGAYLDRIGKQEAVAMLVLQKQQELVVEVGAISHAAPS